MITNFNPLAVQDCIFCKIAAGEIPAYKVFEDDKFICFLDVFPSHKAHTLIVPKEHHETIQDLPDELAAQILVIGKKILTAIAGLYKPAGFNFLQNNGKQSGQEVMHYHMHLIPRFEDQPAGAKNLVHPDGYDYRPSKKELEEISNNIYNYLQ